MLVKREGQEGAVRAYGEPMLNIVTGAAYRGMVLISIGGRDCALLGKPSVRYFRTRPQG